MNVATIEMPIDEAKAVYREYREAVRDNPNARDTAIMLGYQALAQGKAIINLANAIRTAGLDEHRRPKLAVARASWTRIQFRSDWVRNRVRVLAFERDLPSMPGRAPAVRFPSNLFGMEVIASSTARALVPIIPPKLRPGGDLSRFHILWEAEWTEAPKDPLLLKHLCGDLYAVLACWDLTEIERAVLGSRLNLG